MKTSAKAGKRDALESLMAAETGSLPRLPSHRAARLKHHRALARTVARDAAELIQAPLLDGAISAEELAAYPKLVAEATKLEPLVSVERAGRANALDAGMRKRLRDTRRDQKKIIVALRTLRYRDDAAMRKRLAKIARGEEADPADAYRDCVELAAIIDLPGNSEWLWSLPRAEGQAWSRLEPQAEWFEPYADGGKDADVVARAERYARVWAVIVRIEKRVREAGRYLFHGEAKARDYRAFVAPKKPKAKKAVTA